MSRFFDGVDDVLSHSNAAVLAGLTEFTIGIWVRPETKSNPRTIIRQGESGSQPFVDWGISINNSGLVAGYINIGTLHSIDSGTTVTNDQWQLYTLRISDSTNRRALWVNASAVYDDSALAFTLGDMSDNRFMIGLSQQFGEGYKGQAAHAFVYDVVLTDSQIGELYNGGSGGNGKNPLAVQASDLIGYWPLAGTASPEPDESVNNTNLTVSGAVQGASNPPVDGPPSSATYLGAGAAATASSGNVTPAFPGGLAQHDILLCHITALDNVVCSLPSPWARVDDDFPFFNGSTLQMDAWWKRRGSGDSDTDVLVTHAGGGKIIARVHAWRTPDAPTTGNPFVSMGGPTAVSAAAAGSFPNVNVLNAGDFLFYGLSYGEDFTTGPAITNAQGLTLTERDETEVT